MRAKPGLLLALAALLSPVRAHKYKHKIDSHVLEERKRVPMTAEQIVAIRNASNKEGRRLASAGDWCAGKNGWLKPSEKCAPGTDYAAKDPLVNGEQECSSGTIDVYGIHDASSVAKFKARGFHACLALSYEGSAYEIDASGKEVSCMSIYEHRINLNSLMCCHAADNGRHMRNMHGQTWGRDHGGNVLLLGI